MRNLGTLSAAAVCTKIMVFATSLIVSRSLGPTRVGALFTAQAFTAVGALLADLGLTVLTLRDIVRQHDHFARLVSATAAVQTAAAMAFSGLLVLVAFFAPLPAGSRHLLLAMLPLPIAFALNAAYALQAVEDMKGVAAVRLLTVVIASAGSVVLVIPTHNATWPAVLAWVGVLIGDLAAFVRLWRRHGIRLCAVTLAECCDLARRAVPMMLSSSLFIVFVAIDTLSLALLSTARQVGIYSVAWGAVFAAEGAMMLITDAAYPEMVRRWGISPARLCALMEHLVELVIRFSFAGSALVLAEAPALVRLGWGSQFAASATIFRILIWLVPFGGIGLLMSLVLVCADKQQSLLHRRLLTVTVAVIGCPLAAMYGGAQAVAGVILGATLLECTVLSAAAHRLGAAKVIRPIARQLDYLAAPLLSLLLLTLVFPFSPLYLALPIWLLTATLVEARHGFSTLRTVLIGYERTKARSNRLRNA